VEEIRTLRRQGLSLNEIGRILGLDRKTVRKYLEDSAVPRYGPRDARPSKLDPFVPYIEQRLAAGVWNAQVLLREIGTLGYGGGYTILKDYLHPKRRAAREVAVRRFETPPGHQAQVDWGHLGHLETNRTRTSLSGFVMTLGYSRAMFSDVATDQTLPTFLRLHEEAFSALGGVPHEILYDRIKVVVDIDIRGEVRFHRIFEDFARHWGFTPRLCGPYRAQTKGKVESGIRYIRSSCLPTVVATSLTEFRSQLSAWVWGVANRRVHGTTKRVVWEAWQEERLHLQSGDGRPPYPLVCSVVRRVARDAYVSYQSNRYSVPWAAAGCDVQVTERAGRLEIHRDGQQIASHELCPVRHHVLTQPAHHRGMPFGPTRRTRRYVTIRDGAPQVEVRPLVVYEIAGGTS
jgi:transposase